MPSRFKDQDPTRHEHSWVAYDLIEKKCNGFYNGRKCVAIKIGSDEWQRRRDEWQNYYDMCKETVAFKHYVDMKQALADKNHKRRDEILEEIKKTTRVVLNDMGDKVLESLDPIPTPHIPDPFDVNFPYIVEDVR